MATDLSDLDAAQPAAGDAVSAGDDEIRKTRLHTKNWAGIEHYLTGEHKIPNGAAEPAAGFAGRLFVNTTNNRLSRDDGAIWRMVNLVPFGTSYSSGTGTALAAAPTFTVIESAALVIPAGALRLFIFAQAEFIITGGTTSHTIEFRLQFDGSDISQPSSFIVPRETIVGLVVTHHFVGVVNSPTSGTRTVTLRGSLSSASASFVATPSKRLIFGVVI